jgi:hypothetical protein
MRAFCISTTGRLSLGLVLVGAVFVASWPRWSCSRGGPDARLTAPRISSHPMLFRDPNRCPSCGERVTPYAAGCALCGADLDPKRWQPRASLLRRLTTMRPRPRG